MPALVKSIYHKQEDKYMNTSNPNLTISKEWIARHYGKEEKDITCFMCSFSDSHSLDFDTHMMYCTYWKNRVKCNAFCSHYGAFKIEDKKP